MRDLAPFQVLNRFDLGIECHQALGHGAGVGDIAVPGIGAPLLAVRMSRPIMDLGKAGDADIFFWFF